MSTTPVEPVLDGDNVFPSETGAMYFAPLAATPPTTGTSPLTGYACGGYTSDDGVSEEPSSSSNEVHAWQNGAVVMTTTTDGKVEYKVTFIETTPEVVELWHGADLDDDGHLVFQPGATPKKKRFALDIIGNGEVERHAFTGQVTGRESRSFNSTDPRGFGLTITATSNVDKWFTALATV